MGLEGVSTPKSDESAPVPSDSFLGWIITISETEDAVSARSRVEDCRSSCSLIRSELSAGRGCAGNSPAAVQIVCLDPVRKALLQHVLTRAALVSVIAWLGTWCIAS